MAKWKFVRIDGLIDDYDALEEGISRKLGMVLKVEDGRGMFVATDEPFEVNPRPEYVKHVRQGMLAPADKATAVALGVPFNEKQPPKAAPAGGKDQ